jgi:hypothetical protein
MMRDSEFVPCEGDETWFVVWERRRDGYRPIYAFDGPCRVSACNPFHGNCTGPYTRERAEEIANSDICV